MFEKEYFHKLYPKDACIDGDFNAPEHAKYIQSFFQLLEVDIEKVCDFGCGRGRLLYYVTRLLRPQYVEACDVSDYALSYLKNKTWTQDYTFKKTEIKGFKSRHIFDLGICNSVLQYVLDEDLEASYACMAKSCRYLYLHVPSSEDYKVLAEDLDFYDPYAYLRCKERYELIRKKYFRSIGYGFMQSLQNQRKNDPMIDAIYAH
tara:strand:+ start:21028 stop:21639 length:612 start_codon:yes stop_codon:yes gene_type:complete